MIPMLVAAGVAFLLAILSTPTAIRVLRRRSVGQFIQEEVEGHSHKHGTPTMGGVVILVAVVAGYLLAHVSIWTPTEGLGFGIRRFSGGGLLVVGAAVGMGLIGLLDDYLKVTRERNLGLNKRAKLAGQITIAALFAWGAVSLGVSTEIGFARSLGIDLGAFYPIWVLLMLTAAANAVNITDGLDGLAAGSSSLVYGAYMIMMFWIFRNGSFYGSFTSQDLGAGDLAIVAAAFLGATLGFLWWNAAPAKLFMGDVGSQALGGGMAAMALLSKTDLLLVVLGGLYAVETATVILQVVSFRVFGKRMFRMAPIHHHFELLGWQETTIVIRFFILAGIGVALGLGLFYGDFIAGGGLQ
ncbi:MAG: phospho-N-acetylmuramoyl-pentapeptide-transferase [Acidimicrobiia bacterium]